MHAYMVITYMVLVLLAVSLVVAMVWEHYTTQRDRVEAEGLGHTYHALHLVRKTYAELAEREWERNPEYGVYALEGIHCYGIMPAVANPGSELCEIHAEIAWARERDERLAEAEFTAWADEVYAQRYAEARKVPEMTLVSSVWHVRRTPLSVRLGALHDSVLNPLPLTW